MQQNLVRSLCQLAEAYNVCHEARNVVHPGQCFVPTGLPLDQNCVAPLNVGDRSIPKADRAMNSDQSQRTCHVNRSCGSMPLNLGSSVVAVIVLF
jgi:hypothetical protein